MLLETYRYKGKIIKRQDQETIQFIKIEMNQINYKPKSAFEMFQDK